MARLWVVFFSIVSLELIRLCLAGTVDYDSQAVIINGQRKIILSGSIHYPRSTAEMWPDLIKKSKDGGLDTIETYIFWNAHEPKRREYNFTGNLDFIKFFQLIKEAGMYGILRIGPYTCAEWNYGGLPVWLHNIPGIKMRTDNDIFKNEMQTFTSKIVNMAKAANLFFPQGGPVILAQIENEYGNFESFYGDAGKAYVKWCAQMAVAQNIGVPWIMCQQADAPSSVIDTCNGYYCDQFKPNNPKSPKMWTENWSGWYKKWGERDPHRTAEDLAFAVARFFQSGGILQNYYMYHGGTNFGRTSGGPFIITSYDYDAPLNEYGIPNEPKYSHLKNLHAALKLGEAVLTGSTVTRTNYSQGWVELTTYTSNSSKRFCFLSNTKTDQDFTVDLKADGNYSIPAWSISILQDCNEEVFNSAKVNAQTYVMATKLHENDKQEKLSWKWAPEQIDDALHGRGQFKAKQLLEQKAATSDASDYLWYMTRIHNNETKTKKVKLNINYSGNMLHVYVNSKLIDSQYGYKFNFSKSISLSAGTNILSLLSVTVGLKNYGEFFDEETEGIPGGPVTITDGNTTIDLSSNEWSYKVGLKGMNKGRDRRSETQDKFKWSANPPSDTPMTWYQTMFKTPSGSDPVVLDLVGMGKGEASVNGNSLGRFWPSRTADTNGCSSNCDYRGKYVAEKCNTNCGNPTQRWYHVPRSFLKKQTNNLVLFEEIGGNPSNVSVKIVRPDTLCAKAYKGSTLELSCTGGRIMSEIQFASYGHPQGTCKSFKKGDYEAPLSFSIVEKACIGKYSCSIPVNDKMFGVKTDSNTLRLAVQAVCYGFKNYHVDL